MARTQALPFPRPPRPIGLRTIGIAAGLVVIVGLLTVTGALAQIRQRIPGLGPTAPTYQTATVNKGNLAVSVTATGPISAVNNLPLTFKASGKIAEIKVNVGDQVTKGQVLATLDTTDLKASLAQAQAGLASAQASLAKLKAGPTSTQRDVAQVSVDNARSSAAAAAASLDTTKSSTVNDLAAAQAAVKSADTGLTIAQANLASAQDQAKQSLAADQTSLANAQKNLEMVKANVAATQAVQAQQLEQAKDSLWAQQISRDATCGRPGGSCDAANAQVAGSETGLNTAQAQYDAQQKQSQQTIAQAQAQVDAAQAQVNNDQAKLAASTQSAQNAVKQAAQAKEGAQIGLAQAQARATATVQSAQSQVTQAQGAVKAAENGFNQTMAPPAQADLDAAQAQVESAQAAIQVAQANLAGATLTAPFDGTIAAINGTVGQLVSGGPAASGTAGFISLVNLNDLQVTAQVNEADISKIKIGDGVTFNVNAYPDKTFKGQVIQIQPIGTAVQNVITYNVTSSIQGAKGAELYPGMTAVVDILAEERNGVVLVPNTALSFAPIAFREGLVQGTNGAAAGRGQQSRGSQNQAANASSGATEGSARATGRAAGGTTGGSSANTGANRSGEGGTFTPDASRGVVLTLQSGKLVPTTVTLGITDGIYTEIVDGLKGGESIVTGSSSGTASGTNGSRNSAGGGGARGPAGPGGAAFFPGR